MAENTADDQTESYRDAIGNLGPIEANGVTYRNYREAQIEEIKSIVATHGRSTKLDFRDRWEILTSKSMSEIDICLQNLKEDVVAKQSNETAIAIINEVGSIIADVTGIEQIRTDILNDDHFKVALVSEVKKYGIKVPNLAYIGFVVGKTLRSVWDIYNAPIPHGNGGTYSVSEVTKLNSSEETLNASNNTPEQIVVDR